MCSGSTSHGLSDAGCSPPSAVPSEASLPNLADITSSVLCCASFRHSLPETSIFIRLLCCPVSSPSESRMIKLPFRFLWVPCSDTLDLVGDPDSSASPLKHFAHPPFSPKPTKRCDSFSSLWLHCGVYRGSSLWTPMFLSSCLTSVDTQGLGRGSWLRHLSRWKTVVWGRSG